MTTAKKYLEILREREPQLWKEPLKESGFTEKDLSDIEKGLGYKLPAPYREFLLSYETPKDITVLVSFCGDSFACSWSETFPVRKMAISPGLNLILAQRLSLSGTIFKDTAGQIF